MKGFSFHFFSVKKSTAIRLVTSLGLLLVAGTVAAPGTVFPCQGQLFSGGAAAIGIAVDLNSSGQLDTLISSARFKQDIRCLGNLSDALYAFKSANFKYKPGIDPLGVPLFGLVTEEVNKVDPLLVARGDRGRPYTVRYQAANAMLLNGFLMEHRTVEQRTAEIQPPKQSDTQLQTVFS